MTFLRYEEESPTRGKVTFQHFQPNLLTSEQKQGGIEVYSIPDPVYQDGKTPILYINPETFELWYEYVDRPLTQEEEIKNLKQQNAQIMLMLARNNIK
jgi:hypothetical protein